MLQISHLSADYGGKPALADINLTLESGELLVVLGPSGCGKTTLLNLIAGFVPYQHGSITLEGQQVTGPGAERGVVFQNEGLLPWRNVQDNVALGLQLAGVDKAQRRQAAAQMLKKVGLEGAEKRFIWQLSGGQRQRVGIAQALLGAPPLLILDEPTVGLDPEERIHFRNLFSRTAQDRLVLLSTHIIEDVQSVCDRLVVIDHGQILFTGTPEQLIQAAEGHVGVFWEREAGQEQGLHITARVNTSQGVRCRAVADALPAYVQRSEPSLEDAYLYLISREAVQ